MFRKLIVIFVVLLLSITCIADMKESVYENSVFKVVLKERCNKLVYIELINRQTASTYSALPELIVYDDGVPVEGGLVADYNKLVNDDLNTCNTEDVYSCDSVYSIDADSIRICFGRESRSFGQTRYAYKRLDLNIRDSKLPDFIDGNYTLYIVKE